MNTEIRFMRRNHYTFKIVFESHWIQVYRWWEVMNSWRRIMAVRTYDEALGVVDTWSKPPYGKEWYTRRG